MILSNRYKSDDRKVKYGKANTNKKPDAVFF